MIPIKPTKNQLFCSIFFMCGIMFFALRNDWIIIRNPLNIIAQSKAEAGMPIINKKRVNLIFWQENQWNIEHTDLIWSTDVRHNIHYLINCWLTLLDEEHIVDKKVSLQTTLISSSSQDVYLSFDRYPFDQESSIHDKLMWIEGLLKTIRENGTKIQRVHFLVHHTPLSDPHLDFAAAWPINGFLPQP